MHPVKSVALGMTDYTLGYGWFVLEITKGSVMDMKSTSWLRMCYDTVTNEIGPHISRYSENDSFIVSHPGELAR